MQHSQRNIISFRRHKTKIRVITEERITTPPDTSSLYAEGVHMLNGLTEDKMDHFLEEHPTIVPLFEIDVLTMVEPYVSELALEENKDPHKPDP